MRPAILPLLAAFCAILSMAAVAAKKATFKRDGQFQKTKKVMGYYPSYNYKIQSPHQLNYDLYTDVLFFVAVPELNYTFSYGTLNIDIAEKLATEFVQEARRHNVNTLLSIGGWTGSLHFSNLTSSDKARRRFAEAIVNYAQRLGFGGVDLDWEYPMAAGIGCNAFNPRDTINFGKLLKEIRRLWPLAQLTAALSINGLIGADGKPATTLETALLVQYLDFANIMAYDVFGAWAPTTGPIGPICGRCAPPGFNQSVETGVEALLKQGFPASHLILGIPAYAKRLQLVSPKLEPTFYGGIPSYYYQNHTKVTPPGGQTDDKPGFDVCHNKQEWGGSWLVNEIIAKGWLSHDQLHGGNGYVRFQDECSGVPFLTDGKYFIAYDDRFSSAAKARYAKKHDLAGIFFFDTEGAPDITIQASRQAL